MFQVNESSSDFWNNLKLTWQQCADLPLKCWTLSVAELDGKVYATEMRYGKLFMYDSNKNKWSSIPDLPFFYFSLVTVSDRKQLLAVGGINSVYKAVNNKVFVWDEENKKWTTPYPNMPTARFKCSTISHGSTVIVAGGEEIDQYVTRKTRAVEVLHIRDGWFTGSYWSVVERLPHAVSNAIPLIIKNKLYLSHGSDDCIGRTCNVVAASLPELLQSSNKNTNIEQVWYKLPDMPYSSYSINHYQGRLITFGGVPMVEQPDQGKPAFQSVSLIHIYNPDTSTWDCVGEIPHGYVLGISVHIRENKILFIADLIGTHTPYHDHNMTTILTLNP